MYVTLTDIAGKFIYVIPIVPTSLKISNGAENETVETLSGLIRLIGSKKLKSISWDSVFPVSKNYSFADKLAISDGWEYVNFLDNMSDYQIPIRVIITEVKDGLSKRSVLNSLMSIDDFEYSVDKVGDINYSLSLTEFKEDIWDYLNTSNIAKKYFANLNIQSVARQALQSFGLI